jgi:hypothetical protein
MNFTRQNFENFGFAIIFCLVLIVLFGQAMNSLSGEKGLILKTEFVKSLEDFKKLIGNRAEGVKNALLVDTIGFIPVYFLLFALMTWFLAQQQNSWSKYLAAAAAVFAIATIFFDLSENLKVLAALGENSPETLNIAGAAIGKWICFFVTVAILSGAFWKPHFLTVAVAALLILGSLTGLIVLFLAKHEWMQYAIGLNLLGLTICALGFLFFSETAVGIYNPK